jgi:hypothetical protein
LDEDAGVESERVDAQQIELPPLRRGLLSGPKSKATPARIHDARQQAFVVGVVGVGMFAGIAAIAGLAHLLGRRR